MPLIETVRKQLTPIHPEGYIFVAGFAIVTLILGSFSGALFWMERPQPHGAPISFAIRPAARHTPLDENLVMAPADGVVCSIGYFAPAPAMRPALIYGGGSQRQSAVAI